MQSAEAIYDGIALGEYVSAKERERLLPLVSKTTLMILKLRNARLLQKSIQLASTNQD